MQDPVPFFSTVNGRPPTHRQGFRTTIFPASEEAAMLPLPLSRPAIKREEQDNDMDLGWGKDQARDNSGAEVIDLC